MIAAVCWVPKGAAKNVPVVAEPPTEEQLRELLQQHEDNREASEGEEDEEDEELNGDEMEDGGADGGGSSAISTALAAASALGATASLSNGHKSHEDILADGLAELDMDHYDEEDEGVEIFGNGGLGAAYYPSNEEDPYLVDKNDDEEEEIEDMTIKDSDLIILTARNEDDVSHLEYWVYETEETVSEDPEEEPNMYVHHDIMLPAFPLCLSWLDCNPTGEGKGNYVAVGTMQPEIEIWDLDVVDSVEPVSVLGGAIQPASEQGSTEKKSKKKSKKKAAAKQVQYKEGSHTDAVLCLSWNSIFRNVIASASADKSVKIWDIVKGACEHTMNIHTDKVQAVAWNLKEPTVLLSGSFDRTVALTDLRAPQAPAIRWSVPADVEFTAWDPHSSHSFAVSLEDGTVGVYDVRTGTTDLQQGKALFTIHAHDKAACCLAYNTAAPNLLATVSTDKMVKLWDLTDNQPSCIASTNPKVGAVFAASFCKDAPFLLAVGGSKGNLHVWDTLASGEVSRRFGKFSPRPRRVSNNVET